MKWLAVLVGFFDALKAWAGYLTRREDKQAGEDRARIEIAEKNADAALENSKAENKLRDTPADALRERLRRWVRD